MIFSVGLAWGATALKIVAPGLPENCDESFRPYVERPLDGAFDVWMRQLVGAKARSLDQPWEPEEGPRWRVAWKADRCARYWEVVGLEDRVDAHSSFDDARHVDVDGQIEGRDRPDRRRQPLRDRLAHLRGRNVLILRLVGRP